MFTNNQDNATSKTMYQKRPASIQSLKKKLEI